MARVRISRSIEIPDRLRITRYQKNPELGPRILFFSGGSAINSLCRTLKNYTHNSIHLVTPFDSGGSSAKLRQAFAMPAIGDLRNRLLSLADETVLGHPEVYQLFNYRLPAKGSRKSLLKELQDLASGNSLMISDITNPMRQLICNQLGYFMEAIPEDFDLRGASIGNLILAGGYLNNHQHLDPIIFLFSKLVNVQGTVRAIVNKNLHLGAMLENEDIIIGQHLLTAKEAPPIESPVKDIFLNGSIEDYDPATATLRKKNRKLIEGADLIVYPPGSFYTSLMANLLPKGVGTAVAANESPKVFIPNLGYDPEQLGMSFKQMITTLLKQLQKDAAGGTGAANLLNFILVDSSYQQYPWRVPVEALREQGIEVVDTPLISKRSAPYYDDELLVAALLSFA